MSTKLTILLLLFSLTGCTVTNVIPGSSSLPKDRLNSKFAGTFETGKLYVGEKTGFYHSLARGQRLVSDSSAEAYANRILKKLKKSSGVKNIPGKAYLTARNYLGAEATANGNIYIDYGTIDHLENEDQFAALIAHELSHVILNHHNSDVYLKYHKNAVRMSSILNQLKNKVDQIGSSGEKSSELSLVKHLTNSYLVADGAVFPIWTRKQELEADSMALELLTRTNYNVAGLKELFDKMEANRKHAREQEEIRTKKRLAAAQKQGLKTLFSEVGKTFVKNISIIMSNKHPSAETRKENIVEYMEKFEIDLDFPKEKVSSWNRVKKRSTTKSIVKSLTAVDEAASLIQSADIAQADKTLRAKGTVSSQPFSRIVKANLREVQQKKSDAKYNLRIASQSKYSPFSVHLRSYELSNRRSSDFNRLHRAFLKYQKPPNYYSSIIRYAKQNNRNTLATTLQKECIDKYALEEFSCIFVDSDSDGGLSFEKYISKLTG